MSRRRLPDVEEHGDTVIEITFATHHEREAIDVTDRLALLRHPDGFVWIACPHTTCALVLCEADADMLADIEKAASQLMAPLEPMGCTDWLFWQFSGDKFRLPGADSLLDLNWMQGGWREKLGLTTQPAVDVPAAEPVVLKHFMGGGSHPYCMD